MPPRRSRAALLRLIAWIGLATLLIIGNIVLIAPVTLFGKSNTDLYWIVWPTTGLCGAGIAALLYTTPHDAIRLSRPASAVIILTVTGLLHCAGIFLAYPWLSDDMLRYRLDGRMWNSGVAPWAVTPADWSSSQRKTDGISRASYGTTYLDNVTPNPELRTIYPPTAQLVFFAADVAASRIPADRVPYAAATVIASTSKGTWTGSLHAFVFRSVAALCAVVTTLLLMQSLALLGRSAWYALLFAWSPVTVIETSAQGHIDAVGVLFVVIAVAATLRNRWILAAVALAIAAGVKPHVIMLAPVLVMIAWREKLPLPVLREWRKGSSSRAAASTQPDVLPSPLPPSQSTGRGSKAVAIAFLIALVLVYSPLIFSPANLAGWRETAAVYAMSWEANGSIYELITSPFRSGDGHSLERAKMAARLLGGVGAFFSLYLVIRNRLPLADAAYWLFLIPLLLAPVVYPWYLLWGLAMVPLLRRTRGWTMLVWAATSGLSYQLLREPIWRLPAAWALAEYLPVYAALVAEIVSMRRNASRAKNQVQRT